MKQLSTTLLLMLFGAWLSAQSYFEWSPQLKTAYQKVITLQFQEAEQLLFGIKITEPDNLMVHHVENYMDFFRVYINEEVTEFERLEANKDYRLNAIKKGDKTSPYYWYLQANIRLHWALARLKFEEYTTAAFEVNKAFKLLDKNLKKYPDFMPNKKDIGILHAVVGTIPDNYRWIVELISAMEGTFEQGKRELEEVIEYARYQDFVYEEEIYVLYAYLLLHLGNDYNGSWQVINTGKLNPHTSPMAAFIMANVAMRTDRAGEAIQILQSAPRGAEYHRFYYLDYMLGLAKLQHLEQDASKYLLRFVNNFRGKNFIKDAYEKLSWAALINGHLDDYQQHKSKVISEGATTVGSDKSAMKSAEAGEKPNIILLKSRLLFDGGNFKRAKNLLDQVSITDFSTQKERLEYTYRRGRILHKLQAYEWAIKAYQETIDDGRDAEWYFACRAALEIGRIHEMQQSFTKAKAAYETCLSIKPDEHKTGLHHQAKSGLVRLERKD